MNEPAESAAFPAHISLAHSGMAAATVEIAMATWNGAQFLRAQLDSFAAQTLRPVRLVVADDGSSDATLSIVRAWSDESGIPVLILPSETRMGAAVNAGRALSATTAPWVALADQDDVWDAVKIERMLAAAQRLPDDQPVLVHHDARVVDAELQPIAASFWRYQRLRPAHARDARRLLMQNQVTGCTALVNRTLLTHALPIPTQVIMHDHWLALVASAFGTVVAIPEALVAYRQHGGNTIGAQPWSLASTLRRACTGQYFTALDWRQHRHAEQSAAFAARYPQARNAPAARALAQLPDASWWRRRQLIIRHGLWKSGWIRNVGLIARA